MAKKSKGVEPETLVIDPGNLRRRVKSGELSPSAVLFWLRNLAEHVNPTFEKWLERREG